MRVLVILVFVKWSLCQLPSPCPDILKYEQKDIKEDKWYATMLLESQEELDGIWVNIELDRIAEGLLLISRFGEVSTWNNRDFLITNDYYKLQPRGTLTIKVAVKYSLVAIIPSVVGIKLNGIEVCSVNQSKVDVNRRPFEKEDVCASNPCGLNAQCRQGYNKANQERPVCSCPPGYIGDPLTGCRRRECTEDGHCADSRPFEKANKDHGVTPLSAKHSLTTKIVEALLTTASPATPAPFIQIVINNEVKNDPECGMNVVYKPLVFSGLETRSGEYPWLVALFQAQGNGGHKFLCCGSLISTKHIITVAHCMRDIFESNLMKEDLVIILGKHNIKNWARDATIRGVKEYYIHPEYRKPVDADIALLLLDETVTYKTTLKPICLWDESDHLENVVNLNGTMAGWAKDESGKNYIEEPKQIQLPIVSQEICLRSDPQYLKITSNRSFCAGNVNENRGPCYGGSGSGFVMNRNGIWKLRGIASRALLDPVTRMCDANNYFVFTDVSKFVSWIQKLMNTS